MKLRFKFLLILSALMMSWSWADANNIAEAKHKNNSDIPQILKNRPRIVVGLVVDQMCWDYLYKYYNRFGEGGFRRLMKDGFNCDNTLLPYIPSVTAIGHSTVYTGSTPAISGIAGNNFMKDNKKVYCTQDDNEHSVGATDSKAGRMSPRNMLTTTIGDELRLATNMRSKVISVSIKDRAAILPGGHLSNGSFWLDDKAGVFITSTYYMKELPKWLVDFNNKRLIDKYLDAGWNTYYPKNTYTQSTDDNTEYEEQWIEGVNPTLPLDTKSLKEKFGYSVIRTTPMGNTLTLELAKAAIDGEKLGIRESETDMLAISLSSTDYLGHRYGTDAVETEDCYIRLDKDLADFFKVLDSKFGKDGYLFFITADHAAAHNATYLIDKKVPAGAWNEKEAKAKAETVASSMYPKAKGIIKEAMNYQLFLDHEIAEKNNVDVNRLLSAIGKELEKMEGVHKTIISENLKNTTIPDFISQRIQNGYRKGRSGDMFIILDPAWYGHNSSKRPRGTSHGVWALYDLHIPLIFMGKNVPAYHLHRKVYMTDIAATLAQWLGIQTPNGCFADPITEMWND